MDIRQISLELSVSPQISVQDVGAAAAARYRAIICNRPEQESPDQPATATIRSAAQAHGVVLRRIPVVAGAVLDADAFHTAPPELPGPAPAYCRKGTRSAALWAMSKGPTLSIDAVLKAIEAAGYDLSGMRPGLEGLSQPTAIASPDVWSNRATRRHRVVVVGDHAAGISAAASLLARRPAMDIAIIKPNDVHYYQPRWTLVGGGVFQRAETARLMSDVMPKGVSWVRAAIVGLKLEMSQIMLKHSERIAYCALIVAPGLRLNWDAIKGLRETLGKNGVTSNDMFDMAADTWELVQSLKGGKAIFAKPAMPITCAGGPQKAMVLSADHWVQTGRPGDVDIDLCNAGGALCGVADYVPALMEPVAKYTISLSFTETLVEARGADKIVVFKTPQGALIKKPSTCFMSARRRPRTISSPPRPWRMRPGGSRRTPRPCSIRAVATCLAWATDAPPATPRPRLRCASRRRWRPRTSSRRLGQRPPRGL